MTKHLLKKGFITAGILIILALIFGIFFLAKLNYSSSHKTSSSELPFSRETSPATGGDKGFQKINIFGDTITRDLSKYKTADNQLKLVDTAIKPIVDNQYQYANTTNNFETYFPNKPSDIKIKQGDASITFNILTKLIINHKNQPLDFSQSQTVPSADSQKNYLTYSKIYQKDKATIDAVYTIYNDKLSEEMIINQNLGNLEISQNLSLENIYVKEENKIISFYYKTTRQRLWFIPQPKIYEQKNPQEISEGIYYKIECQNQSQPIENCSQLTLTKIIDKEGQKWLSDPKRQYPVVIDPDFQIDNADTAANWISTDTTYFTVSQSTTTKHEGTGSVAISGGTAESCWAYGGVCDAGCAEGGISGGEVYQDCNSVYPNPCGDGEGWQYEASGATTGYYNYWGTPCGSPGSGNCYKLTGSGFAAYTGNLDYCSLYEICPSGFFYPSYGSCSLGLASSYNDSATVTKSPAIDLTSSKSITFWVYSTGLTGSFMQFGMGEVGSTEQTTNFSISSATTWEQKTWDISGIAAASRNAITKFTFKNIGTTASFIFYFDDIQAVAAAPLAPSTCIIRETATDTSLTPMWTDTSSDENGFQLEKSTDGGAFSVLTNLAAGVTGYQDTSVSTGHTYGYRIRSFITGTGSTDFSAYCDFPTLDLHTGSFKFEGVKMEGVKIN